MINNSTTSIEFSTIALLASNNLARLTKQEWKVILLLSKGMTTPQIASLICIEPKSVDNYRTRIGTKLGLKGRNKLVWYAWTNQRSIEAWYQMVNH